MANIILPRTAGTQSKQGWTAHRNSALQTWAKARRQVKVLARVYSPERSIIRQELEEIDSFIRDFLFEPENLKSELQFKDCFFDFELDHNYHNPDIRRELPDQCEATDSKANKAFSAVPRGDRPLVSPELTSPFFEGTRILKP